MAKTLLNFHFDYLKPSLTPRAPIPDSKIAQFMQPCQGQALFWSMENQTRSTVQKNDFLYFYTNRNILQNESYCFVLWIYLKISRRYLTSRYTTIASNTALRYLWKGSNFPESQVFLIDRVEICRDRHDQRCASCVNFPGNQRDFSHNLPRTTRFTHNKCDFALKLFKFYTVS